MHQWVSVVECVRVAAVGGERDGAEAADGRIVERADVLGGGAVTEGVVADDVADNRDCILSNRYGVDCRDRPRVAEVVGIGGMALASLLNPNLFAESQTPALDRWPGVVRPLHHPARRAIGVRSTPEPTAEGSPYRSSRQLLHRLDSPLSGFLLGQAVHIATQELRNPRRLRAAHRQIEPHNVGQQESIAGPVC